MINMTKETNMSYAKLQRSQNRKSDREMTKYFHDKYNSKNSKSMRTRLALEKIEIEEKERQLRRLKKIYGMEE